MNGLFGFDPAPQKLTLSYGLEALISEFAQTTGGQISAETLSLAALRLYPEKVVQKGLESLSKRFINRVERLAAAAPKDSDGQQQVKAKIGRAHV